MSSTISRRDFLKGATAGAAGVAALGLTGLGGATPVNAQEAAAPANGQGAAAPAPAASAPIPPLAPPGKWDMEADIVIVGAGGGGLSAAALATEKGSSVIVVDKLPVSGGGTQHSATFFCVAGGSRLQNEVKYALPTFPFNPDAAVEMFMPAYKWMDRALLRQLIVKGPECIDWMETKGVPWEFDPHIMNMGLVWKGAVEGAFIPLGMKPVTDHMHGVAKDQGAQFIFKTSCQALVRDGARIVGIKTVDLAGQESWIHAKKAVILTAGGFAMNRDMLKEYTPEVYLGAAAVFAMPCDTGECTRMAQGAGADMAGLGSYLTFDGGIDDYAQGTGPWHHYLYSGDNQLSRQPWLSIDIAGKRIPYQSTEPGTPTALSGLMGQADIQMSQIGHRAYVIFDGDYETHILKFNQSICRMPILPDLPNVERMSEYFGPHDWREGAKKGIARGGIKTSDTIEGLGKELGFNPGVLAKAVENWNAVCAAGEDPELNYDKRWLNPVVKPPFYGVKVGGQIESTKAGVRVNPQMQVIDTKGEVIPGLYAGFHTAGGSMGTNSSAATPSVLGSVGLSWTGGYIAAQNAVLEG